MSKFFDIVDELDENAPPAEQARVLEACRAALQEMQAPLTGWINSYSAVDAPVLLFLLERSAASLRQGSPEIVPVAESVGNIFGTVAMRVPRGGEHNGRESR